MKHKIISATLIILLIVGLTYASDNNINNNQDKYEFMDYRITLGDLSSNQFINTFNWFEEQEISFNIKYIIVESGDKRKKYHFSSNQVENVYKELVENYLNDLRELDLDLSAEVAANGFIVKQVMVYTSRGNIEAFVRDKLHKF